MPHVERRTISLLLAFVLCAVALSAGGSSPRCYEQFGWVTDSYCQAAGATAEHSPDCARGVLARGGELLFYSETDHRLYRIADPAAALSHVGQRVRIDGHLELVIHSYSTAPSAD